MKERWIYHPWLGGLRQIIKQSLFKCPIETADTPREAIKNFIAETSNGIEQHKERIKTITTTMETEITKMTQQIEEAKEQGEANKFAEEITDVCFAQSQHTHRPGKADGAQRPE